MGNLCKWSLRQCCNAGLTISHCSSFDFTLSYCLLSRPLIISDSFPFPQAFTLVILILCLYITSPPPLSLPHTYAPPPFYSLFISRPLFHLKSTFIPRTSFSLSSPFYFTLNLAFTMHFLLSLSLSLSVLLRHTYTIWLTRSLPVSHISMFSHIHLLQNRQSSPRSLSAHLPRFLSLFPSFPSCQSLHLSFTPSHIYIHIYF